MARWSILLIYLSLLEVQPNFEPEETYCKTEKLGTPPAQQLNCTKANIHFFQNFNTPLNSTHKIICDDCFLNVIDENSFHFPIRNRINVLDLHNSRIRVLKWMAFKNFFVLKFLNLSNNSIDTLDHGCFSGIKNLVQLDLSSNELQIIPGNLFAELQNLDILNLNRNKIFNLHSDAFFGLSHLKYLYINDNELKRLEDSAFFYLVELKILYLERNQILEIHQSAFRNLQNLSFLYINNNSISYLVQYNFKPLSSLLDLQLRYNNLTEIQTSTFNGLKHLRSLHLGNNQLNLLRPYGLVGLEQLEVLDLTHNELEYVNYFEHFSHLENLRYIWLQFNNINSFVVYFKYEVPNTLMVLDISDNNLTNFNIQLFRRNLPNVEDIYIANNSWNCEFLVNLYSIFKNGNVSVCCSIECSYNVTENYIEEVCNEQAITESEYTDVGSDFATDSSVVNIPIIVLGVISILLVCDIF